LHLFGYSPWVALLDTALWPEHSHLGAKPVYLLMVDTEKIVFLQADSELPVTVGKCIA